MQHISASDFKSQLGQYLAKSQAEPITVNRAGKPVAVVLSPAEYEHLQNMEDLYWIARADAARESGAWVGHDEALARLTHRLGAAE